MASPSLALQVAIVAALKNHTGAGASVFDKVTPGVFPRIAIGSGQEIGEDLGCLTHYDVYFQVDVYSTADGWVQCKTIASEVRALLNHVALPVVGFKLTNLTVQDANYTRETDEKISRARMTLYASMSAP